MRAGLEVQLGALRLANPVLVAAGTFGYGAEFHRAVRLDQLGAIVTKTLTLQPRHGNPPPRLVDTPSGMLNAVGLHNVGLEVFLEQKLPDLEPWHVPVIVSIWAESLQEMAAMVKRLDVEPRVDALELNLSCPNLKHAALSTQQPAVMVAQDAEATAAMVQTARAQTTKPLLAKLSPDVTDIRPIAQAAERAGADAVTLVNTFTGMSLDPHSRRSRLGSLTGGLSGPAIRPLAVWRVWQVHQAVRCPIVGAGGIARAEDAVEFFLAGATAVAVGTATFSHPAAALRVLKGLRRYLARHHLDSIQRLIGTLQDGAAPTPACA